MTSKKIFATKISLSTVTFFAAKRSVSKLNVLSSWYALTWAMKKNWVELGMHTENGCLYMCNSGTVKATDEYFHLSKTHHLMLQDIAFQKKVSKVVWAVLYGHPTAWCLVFAMVNADSCHKLKSTFVILPFLVDKLMPPFAILPYHCHQLSPLF